MQKLNYSKMAFMSGGRVKLLWQAPLFSIFIFTCGFLAVQRFNVGSLSSYVCMLPFSCFLIQLFYGHKNEALTSLLLTMFMLVDNGVNIYSETIPEVRYFIYLSAISLLFIFNTWRVRIQGLPLTFLIIISLLIGCFTNLYGDTPTDISTLNRDLKVLLILSAFIFKPDSTKFDFHILFVGMLGCLVGEFLNGLFFYRDYDDYMSYNSTKAFIIFPAAYAILTNKNLGVKILLVGITAYVIFLFGTRMIPLSLAVSVALYSFFKLIKNKNLFGFIVISLKIISPLFFFASIFTRLLADTEFIRLKAFSFIFIITENLNFSSLGTLFEILDPVRFYEHQIFFQRTLLEIFFGGGLGSGIKDVNGLLHFVTMEQTAFSQEEITSSIFFNFHDFWIDFGLRFGLLTVFYLIYILIFKSMARGDGVRGIIFAMVLINTTYSMAGILLSALLIRYWPINNDLLKEKSMKIFEPYRRFVK